jgi:hypothetical protein
MVQLYEMMCKERRETLYRRNEPTRMLWRSLGHSVQVKIYRINEASFLQFNGWSCLMKRIGHFFASTPAMLQLWRLPTRKDCWNWSLFAKHADRLMNDDPIQLQRNHNIWHWRGYWTTSDRHFHLQMLHTLNFVSLSSWGISVIESIHKNKIW